MGRARALFLTVCAVGATALALLGPVANADRPLSDIACTRGERATYDRGHQFEDGARVLGCVPLASGRTLQLDASPGTGQGAAVCLWLNANSPPQGLFACPKRFKPRTRVLLILRHGPPRPVLVTGIAPPDVVRLAVAYFTESGARERVPAELLRAGAPLAARIGADQRFVTFVAELEPEVSVCRGIKPLAFDRAGSRRPARSAAPAGGVLARPDGWLAGFAQSYGVGYGPGRPPSVCDRQSPAVAADSEGQPAGPLRRLGSMFTRLLELVRSGLSEIAG
jgi:hypothetical protein